MSLQGPRDRQHRDGAFSRLRTPSPRAFPLLKLIRRTTDQTEMALVPLFKLRLPTLALVFALTWTAAASADEYAQAAKILERLKISAESALNSHLAERIARDSAFVTLVKESDATTTENYVRSLVAEEVRFAAENPARYPLEFQMPLQDFIAAERERVPPIHAKFKDWGNQALRNFGEDADLIRSGTYRPNADDPAKRERLKKFDRLSPRQQAEHIAATLSERSPIPESVNLAEDWMERIGSNPVKYRESLVEWAKIYDVHATPETEAIFLRSAETLIEAETVLAKVPKWKRVIGGHDLKGIRNSLNELRMATAKLSAAGKLLVRLSTRGAKFSQLLHHALNVPQAAGITHDYLGLALEGVELNLRNPPKGSLSEDVLQVIRERIEGALETGRYRPIGPELYAKLLREQPSLAAKYRDYFFKVEIFPSWIGDPHFQEKPRTVGILKFNGLEHTLVRTDPVEAALTAALDDLAASDSPLKKEVQSIVAKLTPTQARTFWINEHFEEILPFLDPNSPDGARLIFEKLNYTKPGNYHAFRRGTETYFRYLAENPEALLRDLLRDSERLGPLSTFFQNSEEPFSKLFPNDRAAAKRFAEAYLASAEKLQAIAAGKMRSVGALTNIHQWDAAKGYRSVLQWYLSEASPSAAETELAMQQFEKILTPAPGTTWAWNEKTTLGKVREAFQKWLRKLPARFSARELLKKLPPEEIEKLALLQGGPGQTAADPRCEILILRSLFSNN